MNSLYNDDTKVKQKQCKKKESLTRFLRARNVRKWFKLFSYLQICHFYC